MRRAPDVGVCFRRCGVDGAMCDLLDDELLEHQMGMAEMEHRQRFLVWVEAMQVRTPPGGGGKPPEHTHTNEGRKSE